MMVRSSACKLAACIVDVTSQNIMYTLEAHLCSVISTGVSNEMSNINESIKS